MLLTVSMSSSSSSSISGDDTVRSLYLAVEYPLPVAAAEALTFSFTFSSVDGAVLLLFFPCDATLLLFLLSEGFVFFSVLPLLLFIFVPLPVFSITTFAVLLSFIALVPLFVILSPGDVPCSWEKLISGGLVTAVSPGTSEPSFTAAPSPVFTFSRGSAGGCSSGAGSSSATCSSSRGSSGGVSLSSPLPSPLSCETSSMLSTSNSIVQYRLLPFSSEI